MAIKKIIFLGDKTLRSRSLPITKFGTKELIELEIDLRETLNGFKERFNYGRGIAAIQLGVPKNVIYIKTEEFEGMLINPEIKNKSKKMFWTWDSCFSVNNAFFIKVLRHCHIEVNYSDLQGNKNSLTASKDLAELLQHEIDHLYGQLFIDLWDKDKNKFIMKEEYSN